MSTVILLKDDPRGKKGATISVPFGTGKELIAAGVAAYPVQPKAAAPATPSPPSLVSQHAAEITRLNESHAAAIAQLNADAAEAMESANKAHAKELGKLQAELDAANARITEMQKKQK